MRPRLPNLRWPMNAQQAVEQYDREHPPLSTAERLDAALTRYLWLASNGACDGTEKNPPARRDTKPVYLFG